MAVCEIPWIIYGLFKLTLHSNIVQQAVLLLSDVWKKWKCSYGHVIFFVEVGGGVSKQIMLI